MTNTNEIKAALSLIASFTGEDAGDFSREMCARKSANLEAVLCAAFQPKEESTNDGVSIILRTEKARTTFDSRVLGLLGRNRGSEVTAANLITRYGDQTGYAPSGAQMRASLNRLIESGDVDYSGIQRGTKYAVA